MKIRIIYILLLTIVTSVSLGAIPTHNTIIKQGNIVAGSGYSSDSQQIAPQDCFDATASSVGGGQTYLNLDTAVSFSDLERQLHIDISTKGGYGMFSGSAEASYMHEVEDKDYSLSVNYYEYSLGDTSVNLKEDVLNDSGKAIYKNGTNPYFGLVCGDNYISSFKAGALLSMSINVNFASHHEKEEFNAAMSGSYGDMFSASSKVQQIATEKKLNGSVSITAFQKGGKPSQLSQILKKDSNGNYYVLTCDLQNMDNCVNAANGLLDYAKSNFSTQFSFRNDTGLVPLGLGYSRYEPIDYIGLTPPKSFVTPEVLQYRMDLADELLKNQYYQQKFYELFTGYPVQLDLNSDLFLKSQALAKKAENNLTILFSADNPEQGAQGCFDFPDKCPVIYQNLKSKLTPVNSEDLNYLNGYDGIQYIFQIHDIGAYLYNAGDHWVGVPHTMTNGDTRTLSSLSYFKASPTAASFDAVTDVNTYIGHYIHFIFNGASTDGISFSGTQEEIIPNNPPSYGPLSIISITSPYYFGAYNNQTDNRAN